MKAKYLFPVLSLVALSAFAQVAPNKDYVTYPPTSGTREMIDNVPSALDLTNSAVYISGYTRSLVTGRDYLLIKYDLNGNILWQKTFDYSGLNDRALAITVDNSGNVIITGEAISLGNGTDIITRKYDTNGNLLWSSTYNGTANADDKGLGVITDNSGDIYLCGYSSNTGTGKDFTVIRYNSSGVQQYVYTKNGTSNGDDIANAIAFFGNKLYVAGNITNTGTGADIYITRLNANNASVNWSKTENGTASTNDQGLDIKVQGNDVLVCGGVNNTGTGQDYFFGKYNATNGTSVFTKTYDGFGTNDFATSLVLDASNTYAITGLSQNGTNYEYHTTKYNNSGTLSWVNKHKTNAAFLNVFPKIAVDNLVNHFYVSGVTFNSSIDAALYQITPGGNESWADYHDGFGLRDAHVDLSVDNLGRIYLASLNERTPNIFDIALIRYSQTPVYFPPDFSSELPSKTFTYFKNSGQIFNTSSLPASDVLYYSYQQNPEVYIERNAYDYVFARIDTNQVTPDSLEKIQVNFVNSNPLAQYYNYNPKGAPINYIIANPTGAPIVDVKGNERVFIPNFYSGIDLHYYSNKDGIKYYFVVKPGFSLEDLLIQIDGATSTSINGSFNLFIDGVFGDIELKRPVAYNINPIGNIIPVSGNADWLSVGSNDYRIAAPAYNPALPLVIEISSKATSAPSGVKANLDYSTYHGGNGDERFYDIKVASNGDRFVTGYTSAQTFPTTNAIFPNFFGGSTYDAVLLKYLANDSLKYSTFYGGNGVDIGNSVTVDSNGDVFFGGQTFSTDLIVNSITGATNQLSNGYFLNTSQNQKADGFIVKLNARGDTLRWARYFGGSKAETVNSLFIDGSNNLYVAGNSSSSNFPVVNAYKPSIGTTLNTDNFDAIYGKFNSSLAAQWITYYGGTYNGNSLTYTQDDGTDITVDNSGKVICSGWTDAIDFPTQNTTGNTNVFYQTGIFGNFDGFLVRFGSGGVPDYSTYFGGNGNDYLMRLVQKPNTGNIYFAGSSSSNATFPWYPKAGAFNYTTNFSGSKAFLGYIDFSLSKQWCSFYGNQQPSKFFNIGGLSVDDLGAIYLSGYTNSDSLSFPVTPFAGAYFDNTRSSEDAFLAIFDNFQQIMHSTFLGGTGVDRIHNSDTYGNNKLYTVGRTVSNNFPIAYTISNASLIDSTYNGGEDGFISRFDLMPFNIIGVKELSNQGGWEIIAYPNPANETVTIKSFVEQKSAGKLNVSNLLGQIIFSQEIQTVETIDVSKWKQGVYVFTLDYKDFTKSFKIIKD